MKVQKSALVLYSADLMYELVNRVDAYPEFLPWCGGAQVLEESEDSMVAEIVVDFKELRQSFKTANELIRPANSIPGSIKLHLIDGPFKSLSGEWRFYGLGDLGSRIEFDLDYEFSSVVLSKLLSPVFGRITETFVDSFVARAEAIHD
jgi:ribosome-associated toxin RatA of RatAB toxin-antitoxin module